MQYESESERERERERERVRERGEERERGGTCMILVWNLLLQSLSNQQLRGNYDFSIVLDVYDENILVS